MQAVIDTVSMQHLLRAIKPSKNNVLNTAIDKHINAGRLCLAVDDDLALIDEWCSTCGREYITVLINKWEYSNGLLPVILSSPIHMHVSRNLRILGFTDTIDKLILRIAVNTVDRVVVSDDSDFWDPADPGKRGDSSTPVAKICKNDLNISLYLLSTFLKAL